MEPKALDIIRRKIEKQLDALIESSAALEQQIETILREAIVKDEQQDSAGAR